ncbi:hypothetical protein ES707_16500 [subsurface metagenome]
MILILLMNEEVRKTLGEWLEAAIEEKAAREGKEETQPK